MSPEVVEILKRLDDLLESAKQELPNSLEDIRDCVEETKNQLREGTTWSKAKRLFFSIKGFVCESGKLAKAVMDAIDFAQKVLPV